MIAIGIVHPGGCILHSPGVRGLAWCSRDTHTQSILVSMRSLRQLGSLHHSIIKSGWECVVYKLNNNFCQHSYAYIPARAAKVSPTWYSIASRPQQDPRSNLEGVYVNAQPFFFPAMQGP